MRVETHGTGRRGGVLGGKRGAFARDGDGMEAVDETGEMGEIAFDVLRAEHAADHPGGAGRHFLQRFGEGCAGGGIVSAVEPELCRPRDLDEGSLLQPLHARGPVGVRDRCLAGRGVEAEMAQRHDRRAGVRNLVGAAEVRQRQVEQPRLVLHDEAAGLLADVPMLAGDERGRAHGRDLRFDDRETLVVLGGDDHGHPTLDDAGLFARDLGERLAEKLLGLARIDLVKTEQAGRRDHSLVAGDGP